MNRPIVKISYIEINNFKNVKRGRISIGIEDIKSSNIIGIYDRMVLEKRH